LRPGRTVVRIRKKKQKENKSGFKHDSSPTD